MPQILEHIWQMKAPQIILCGLLLFQRHPHRESHMEWGTGDSRGVVTAAVGQKLTAKEAC